MQDFIERRFRKDACPAGLLVAVAFILHLLAGSQIVSAAEASAPIPEKLRLLTDFFEEEVASGRLPGAVVLIQQHGQPVYLKTFGVRDIKTGQPMTVDTQFALLSMTKPITSFAAMMLIDEGKLSLDDPVAKYVPSFADRPVGVEGVDASGKPILEFVAARRPPTIRDLLQHTSGIAGDYVTGGYDRYIWKPICSMVASAMPSLPSASQNCRSRSNPAHFGATAIRSMCSAASSRSSLTKRSIIS